MLRIYNSLTGRKEELQPIRPGEIGMYVCGDTVYDFCHIGHARSKVAFDVVRRYLQWRGYRVRFVRNITDIDDKIIRRAAELGEPIEAFTARFIEAMHADYDRLGILRPDAEPRATQHVGGMIALTAALVDKGHAYVAPNGDVMYSVASFAPYGRLSGKRLADLRAGARVGVDEAKRDPLDFVLWKRAKPGEPAWESPWGPGRPGWHIECSAMSHELLGTHFDIHGGGLDLQFPHHENEIAQSCAASGDRFANLWMHNGFVNVDDEKMSKSLGNFFTIRAVLDSGHLRHPEVLRFFLMSSHYRGPINYSLEQVEQADAALGRLYTALRGALPPDGAAAAAALAEQEAAGGEGEATGRFREAMDDDFNTPEALAVLQSLASDLNRAGASGDAATRARLAAELRRLGNVLGVLTLSPAEWFRLRIGADQDLPAAEVEALIEARREARRNKDFRRSDQIRDQLAAAGVILEDKPGGVTQWRYR
ncbi:MAG: cysteine--tRNA ligase [Steroidobacteraceae bacterium]|nr:cysteine--tRNA ligase [Nevskiaceae bacterium]MCP5359136.1 cysteine--tRNA ligase [Nevskiaceae bacterium]MCP5466370.1 cysteine--tRNA ligase [Nevskiaceae bacterium]